ncbi:hypothetical protein BDV96DRAFT_609891 [Lophiotrema nucula]|uniref:Tocopherol cyclase-domain-containing protein n=1 Tax=Lophiotrema nucula TaxID=690887 RepID=A0A6A5ZP61_9PLEO|nr:hypothetical protein BDV96DRAFT_609891 [Lophiotrema nucula]
MEHFKVHPKTAFEGWYSKFDLPSGGHLALIICSVPNASKLPPHMVSFTFYPKSGKPIFQREHWVSNIERVNTGQGHAFELRAAGIGVVRTEDDNVSTYELKTEEWSFSAKMTKHVPWGAEKSTPEGWLVRLPLPLHWHVNSLGSTCDFQLEIPSLDLSPADKKGTAVLHQEKNWASSFPSAHMWVQARDGDRGICIAGGKILGMTAYMLGYRSSDLDLDIIPPYAISVMGLSPFMSVDVDWETRSFSLSVQSVWKKVVVRAKAPKDKETWFGLGSPFPDGHRPNFCTESFLASVEVEVWERSWWGSWKQLRRENFENASLEYGGDLFPERGEKRE